MSELSCIIALIQDIKETLNKNKNHEFVNLSACKPLLLPEIELVYKNIAKNIVNSSEFGDIICRYGGSNSYSPLKI